MNKLHPHRLFSFCFPQNSLSRKYLILYFFSFLPSFLLDSLRSRTTFAPVFTVRSSPGSSISGINPCLYLVAASVLHSDTVGYGELYGSAYLTKDQGREQLWRIPCREIWLKNASLTKNRFISIAFDHSLHSWFCFSDLEESILTNLSPSLFGILHFSFLKFQAVGRLTCIMVQLAPNSRNFFPMPAVDANRVCCARGHPFGNNWQSRRHMGMPEQFPSLLVPYRLENRQCHPMWSKSRLPLTFM